MPIRVTLNGGQEGICPGCGHPYEPPPGRPTWRMHPECYVAHLEEQEHAIFERGRQAGMREERLRLEAELDSLRVQLARAEERSDHAHEDMRMARLMALGEVGLVLQQMATILDEGHVPDTPRTRSGVAAIQLIPEA